MVKLNENRSPKAHPLVRFVKAGRGYGVTLCPVLTFVASEKGVLHIVDGRPGHTETLCGTAVAATLFYTDFDARAVEIKRRAVCAKCRTTLGRVPPPFVESKQEGAANG